MVRYAVLITLAAVGCGGAEYSAPPSESPDAEEAFEPATAVPESMAEADSGEEPLPLPDGLDRRIIYTAQLDLVVEQFDPVPAKVEEMAERFGGFVASSTVSGMPGYPRTGDWTLRVPVERYGEFLAAARQLGEVHRESVDSQDVTEEYYDVEARIRNKKTEETRLLELLETATGELEDVLAVERELSRVRGEIERVEGRLRVLKDLTSLTTITLTVREIKGYVPEQSASYLTRVRRGFQASIRGLVATAKAVSIALIVSLPWLPVLLALWALWRLLRRKRRRASERKTAEGPS